MVDNFAILYRLRVFTLSELAEATQRQVETLKVMLLRWQALGLLKQIRRNLYCVVDLTTGYLAADQYEIACHISPTACISYHSALEFHGLAHQTFYSVQINSQSRFSPFRYNDIDYCFYREPIGKFGQIHPNNNAFVCVSDRERTLIDCFDRIERAGGIEELLHCMESIVMVNEEKLLEYLALYNKKLLYQKTGFLMEKIKDQANISGHFFDFCKSKSGSSPKQITGGNHSYIYNKEWNLYIPQSLTKENEEYELI